MKIKTFLLSVLLTSVAIAEFPTTPVNDTLHVEAEKEYVYKSQWKKWFRTSLSDAVDGQWAVSSDGVTYQYNATEGAWKYKIPYSADTVVFVDSDGKLITLSIPEAKQRLGIVDLADDLKVIDDAFNDNVQEVDKGGTGITAVPVGHFIVGKSATELEKLSPADVKGAIGVGNVDNFGTASTGEAQAGSADNKFMTPAKTKDAILALAPTPVIASKLEAEQGVLDSKFMTPAKTKDAILKLAPDEVLKLSTTDRVALTDTAEAGILVYDTDEQRLYSKHANGYWVEK